MRTTPLLAAAVCPAVPGNTEGPNGTLRIRAAVIASDLTVRPVPKHAFTVRSLGGAGSRPALRVVTGFDGLAEASLAPGRYGLSSESPLRFEGREFTWDLEFDVGEGAVVELELSNDNAGIRDLGSPPSAGGATFEQRLFERFGRSVFTIEAEGGKGSGFLVDERCLILTTYHVVQDSAYLAVKIDERTKYPGRILSGDDIKDLAAVWISPEACAGLDVLDLAGPEVSPVTGEPVVIIGSPLSQETVLSSGIVSKVEEEAILTDVAINPGNSGGPMLDARGRVVGIVTFHESGGDGPGVGGVVRAHLAGDVVARARERAGKEPAPPDTRLPVVSDVPYPVEALEKEGSRFHDLEAYTLEAGKMEVSIWTPSLAVWKVKEKEREAVEGQRKRGKKRRTEPLHDSSGGFYSWMQYVGAYEPVVTIFVWPEVKQTRGSKARVFTYGGAAEFRFLAEFRKMHLMRDGKEVLPIHPGKIKRVWNRPYCTDVQVFGAYDYPPDAFEPGARVEIQIYNEEETTKPVVVKFPEATLESVWRDFQPWREAVGGQESGD